MRVLVSGSSGLIGSTLIDKLNRDGHETLRLVRPQSGTRSGGVSWDPQAGTIDRAGLESIDAVVHLAGDNIADGRWTEAKKQSIRDSRVKGTRLLAEALSGLERRPAVFISASGINIYGDRGDERLTELSVAGEGFLADVVKAWESATAPAAEAGIRVAYTRFGAILSPEGGALAKMLTPFKLGAGGVIGNGKQYMCWIALDDVLAVIEHLLCTESLAGPVNVAAPTPVTNREFTKTLGAVLHRPTIARVPAVAARLAFGEMADEVLLASVRAFPEKLQQSGYTFRYPHLDEALRHLLDR